MVPRVLLCFSVLNVYLTQPCWLAVTVWPFDLAGVCKVPNNYFATHAEMHTLKPAVGLLISISAHRATSSKSGNVTGTCLVQIPRLGRKIWLSAN